jgi:D-3-phosphoglycerate dehydrogenase
VGTRQRLTTILSVAALKVARAAPRESVNFVNAQQIARARGIDISSTMHPTPRDYANLITFRACSATEETSVSGTLFHENNQRVVSVNDYRVEFKPEGHVLYILNKDVPGVVGRVGTILGEHEVNIAEYNLARSESGGTAMAIVTTDSPISTDALTALRLNPAIKEVRQLKL